jgi:uncharacterized oxidoreductase
VNITNNTILITGGGSGIGLALAVELLKYNNKVIISGRSVEKLQKAKNKYSALEIIQCDISKEDSVRKLVQEIHKNHDEFNFLVNNAGLMKFWNIQRATTSINQQKEEILTNIFGTFQLTQSLVPHLLKRDHSAILNISSALAFVPMAAAPVYNATKAAIHSYSVSIRQQLRRSSIKVFEVLPAAIDTQMATDMEKIVGMGNSDKKMAPEKLAGLIVSGIRNNNLEIRPGMANMLYYIHRFFPTLAQNMIRKQSEKILPKL